MNSETEGSPAINGGAEDRTPEQVQAEIDQTRAELGDTVEALVAKTDVKAQAKAAVNDAKATVADKAAEVKQTVVGKKDDVAAKATDVKQTVADKKDEATATARETTPESVGETGRRAVALAHDNRPALMVAGAFALGLLIGSRRGR